MTTSTTQSQTLKTIYTFELSIGYSNAKRSTTINILDNGEYTEETWRNATEEEREDYLDELVKDWANDYIEHYWK